MPRILLVDDDIAEISGVKRLLARAGHAAELATNAADALTAVERAAPDLLVLAAACDEGRALALAQRLAGRRATAALPMLILGEAPGLPSGVRGLPRPVDPGQLGAAIDALLGGARTAPPPARRGSGAGPAPAGDAASASPAAPRARAAAAEALRAHAEAMRRSGEAKVVAAPASAADAAVTTAPGDASRPTARAPSPAQRRSATPPPTATQPPRPALDVDSELEDLLRYIGGEPSRASSSPAASSAPSSTPAPSPAQPATTSPAPSRSSATPTAPSSARATSPATSSTPSPAPPPTTSSARMPAASSSAPSSARATSPATSPTPSSAPPPAASSATSPARSPADVEALRAQEAEEQAAAEREARRRAEEELERVRRQLEAERRTAEERIASVMEQAAAEELAAEELRRVAEEEARRRAEEEEQRLRDAIASAQAELAALRRKGEEETRRRAAAEAELWRVTELASVAPPAPVAPPPAFAPYPGLAPAPIPPAEPAEEAARRRVAALRSPPAAPPTALEPALGREPAAEPAAPAPITPPPQELRGGTLAELPAPRLLALAARARLAGRLDFEGEVTRSLWFEEGRVVGASSADPGERVEELALRLGLITRDQHRQVAAAAATLPSRRAALLLLERGFLKANELTILARRRAEEVVFGIFGDEGARFRWVAQEVMPEERTALERAPLALAVEGVRRRWRAPHLERVLGGPGTLLSPAPDGPSAGELGLSAEERRAVALADGLRALDEIVHASPLDDVSTRQVLAALVLVGALSVRLLQAGRPAAGAARAIDLARVGDKLDQVRRADYFTVLGVGRRCTPHEIREAAERLEHEFDPRRHAGSGHEGLPERLEEILQVIRDARDVLTDDRLRDAYLGGLGD